MNAQRKTTSCPPPGSLTRRAWILALAVALAACLIRIFLAGQRGLGPDELQTLHVAHAGISDLIRDRLAAGQSPLYFLYAKLGLLFGLGERPLRLTSALAAGATVLLLTGLLGELRLRRALPALWLVAALAPGWLQAGATAHAAMTLVALAAGAAWLAVRDADRPTLPCAAALALATGLLPWIHPAALALGAGLLAFQAWDGLYTGVGRPREERLRQAARRALPVLAGLALGAPAIILACQHPANPPTDPIALKSLCYGLIDGIFGEHRLWFNFMSWPHHSWLFNVEVTLVLAALWLAWRELRRQRNKPAWRLLASLIIATPLLFLLRLLGSSWPAPLPALAGFTLPAVLCLALAAHATAPVRGAKALYGAALLFVLAFQGSAVTLDRGDRHRDAVDWLKRNYQDGSPLILCGTTLDLPALACYGFIPADPILMKGFTQDETRAQTADWLQLALQRNAPAARRLFYLRYRSQAPIADALELLVQKGVFAGHRKWRITRSQLLVGVAVRDKADLPWLNALPAPSRQWGPAQTDRQ